MLTKANGRNFLSDTSSYVNRVKWNGFLEMKLLVHLFISLFTLLFTCIVASVCTCICMYVRMYTCLDIW